MLDKVKNTLKLILSDFDIVDGELDREQYVDPKDCPVARALKRTYGNEIGVTCDGISINYEGRQTQDISQPVIRKALKRLQKTGTYAVIRLFPKLK